MLFKSLMVASRLVAAIAAALAPPAFAQGQKAAELAVPVCVQCHAEAHVLHPADRARRAERRERKRVPGLPR